MKTIGLLLTLFLVGCNEELVIPENIPGEKFVDWDYTVTENLINSDYHKVMMAAKDEVFEDVANKVSYELLESLSVVVIIFDFFDDPDEHIIYTCSKSCSGEDRIKIVYRKGIISSRNFLHELGHVLYFEYITGRVRNEIKLRYAEADYPVADTIKYKDHLEYFAINFEQYYNGFEADEKVIDIIKRYQ